jgi:phytoene synthase
VYLPQEDLRAFGVTTDDLRECRYGPAFVRLMEREAERARGFYRAAWESYPVVDARSLVPAEIMGRIYFALLEEIERRRFRVFDGRVALPARRKVAVALGCWLRARYARAA